MCGKSAQAVAKWEKGQAVPVADGNLIRLAWLGQFSKKDLPKAVWQMSMESGDIDGGDYVMSFDGTDWVEDRQHVRQAALQQAVEAMRGIKQTAYTAPETADFVALTQESEALA